MRGGPGVRSDHVCSVTRRHILRRTRDPRNCKNRIQLVGDGHIGEAGGIHGTALNGPGSTAGGGKCDGAGGAHAGPQRISQPLLKHQASVHCSAALM
jgi:hypothetical protein